MFRFLEWLDSFFLADFLLRIVCTILGEKDNYATVSAFTIIVIYEAEQF